MKLSLHINNNLLIAHTLQSNKFSDSAYEKDVDAFKDKAWEISQPAYNVIVGRSLHPNQYDSKQLLYLSSFFERIQESDEFNVLLRQTENYKTLCKTEWEANYEYCYKYLTQKIGIPFKDDSFTCYITHPGLCHGKSIGNNEFMFGHAADWPNYSTVYFWHEILHSYFGESDLEHALIEFITDEEMRARLNNISYPDYVGHKNLAEIKDKIFDQWKEFLNSDKWNDVFEFKDYLLSQGFN